MKVRRPAMFEERTRRFVERSVAHYSALQPLLNQRDEKRFEGNGRLGRASQDLVGDHRACPDLRGLSGREAEDLRLCLRGRAGLAWRGRAQRDCQWQAARTQYDQGRSRGVRPGDPGLCRLQLAGARGAGIGGNRPDSPASPGAAGPRSGCRRASSTGAGGGNIRPRRHRYRNPAARICPSRAAGGARLCVALVARRRARHAGRCSGWTAHQRGPDFQRSRPDRAGHGRTFLGPAGSVAHAHHRACLRSDHQQAGRARNDGRGQLSDTQSVRDRCRHHSHAGRSFSRRE